jgi:hypothetical protein
MHFPRMESSVVDRSGRQGPDIADPIRAYAAKQAHVNRALAYPPSRRAGNLHLRPKAETASGTTSRVRMIRSMAMNIPENWTITVEQSLIQKWISISRPYRTPTDFVACCLPCWSRMSGSDGSFICGAVPGVQEETARLTERPPTLLYLVPRTIVQ